MKKWLVRLGVAALLVLLTASVALATSVVEVESVQLPEDLKTIDVGATLPLEATITPEDAGATVTWKSSRTQYAVVRKLADGSWVLIGKRMGKTRITVKAGGKSDDRVITVTAPKASSIKLNKTSLTLNPSGSYSTYILTAKLTPVYHSDSVTWSTDGEGIVSIAPSGNTCVVTAEADGSETMTATVTATLDKAQKSASCDVTVTKIPEKYVRLTTRAVVPLGATRPLTAVVYPTNAFDRTITWSVVKNEQVASVDEDGVVTGLTKGTAVIQASTANGRSARSTVTVKEVRYSSFSVTPSSKTVEKGKSYALKIKRSPAYVSYPDVAITSSDESVATIAKVDGVWTVTGTGRGYAKLYVVADKVRVKRTLSVRVLDYENPVTVSVSAIGDVMLGGDPRKSSYSRFEGLWEKGASYFFAKIKSELKGVAVANLEIPLINTSGVATGSRSYIFRGRTAYAQALEAGGIDAVDLDNNHIMDYGTRGYTSTKSAVKALGIGSFGRGGVCYITKNGIKIGFAGFRPENISISKMRASVKALKQRCDIAVISFHWGVEYRKSPTAQQRAYGRAAVLAGADLVLGHGSHVVSGIELYKGKHIVYGLGTIVSTVALPDDIDCFIYQHTFSVLGTTVSNASFDVVPVLMTDNTSYNDAQPVLATGSDATRIKNKIEQYSPDNNPF